MRALPCGRIALSTYAYVGFACVQAHGDAASHTYAESILVYADAVGKITLFQCRQRTLRAG